MTDIPRDHQASLLPWLQQAAVGIAIFPTSAESTIYDVEVNNGLGGHAGAGSTIARCSSATEAELVAVALWALVDRHWPRDETGETIRVSGTPHSVKDIDDAAHATLHDPHATERERGMAATIMALVDERSTEPGRVGADYVRCSRCGKQVSNRLPGEVIVRAFVECPECVEAQAAQESTDA